MLNRTYISKFNTIIGNSVINTGISPISELVYGAGNNTRAMIYFDHTKLQEMVKDKTYPNINKFKHILKITNAGSVDYKELNARYQSNISNAKRVRAASFDLIFFLIPQEWDNGKGFDYSYSICNEIVSEDGSNWFQAKNGHLWEEEGIFSTETLSKEYDNFSSEKGSTIVIGRQHFDIGNENISIDITDVVNKFITEELPNYGIGIAFTPMTELMEEEVERYIGFFTHKTHTFFEPFLETHYEDYISDDRNNFILDKNNKLYLYCNIGGETQNLDELPTCHINDTEYEVKQFSKGIYYVDINLSRHDFKPNTMLYDVWSNIVYQGTKLDDIELDFVVKMNTPYFNIGNSLEESTKVTPKIYGISNDEKIFRNDEIRKVSIINRISYDRNKTLTLDSMYYRLYVMDGTREINVIPFTHVNKSFLENYFLLNCNMLIPQKYHIDVKVNYNQESTTYKDILEFQIVDNLNNKYY